MSADALMPIVIRSVLSHVTMHITVIMHSIQYEKDICSSYYKTVMSYMVM